MFGMIKSFEQQGNLVIIYFEHHTAKIEIMTKDIINVFVGLETKEHLSRAIEGNKTVRTDYTVRRVLDKLIISTSELIVEIYDELKVDFYNKNYELLCSDYRGTRKSRPEINEKAFGLAALEGHAVKKAASERTIEVVKTMDGDEAFYGLGDKTGFLNKRGYEYEMWNSDLPDPQTDSFRALYKSIPFFITLKQKHVFGIFFDNTYRTFFDMGKESEDYYSFSAEGGNLDYYFILGSTMAEVVGGYTYLTGTTPLPQQWTLGYHQSRWSYESKEAVMELANNFRKHDIPCDCIHLDIDYMEAYKVFTFDEEHFPKIEDTVEELAQLGIKLVTIIDPGVKIEKGYSVYEEGVQEGYYAKDVNGEIYENVVWPGTSVFPDFSDHKVRSWWGDHQKVLLEKGIRGVWNDMNEPASFRGPLPDEVQFSDEGRGANHRKIHNVYGHLMAEATYQGIRKHDTKRPYVITRACYSGSQKYTTAWTGDNHSIWAHLQMAIPQLCNLGLSGMAFSGTDVGGFGSDCTSELLCRWVQLGCFSPFFRNHSGMGTRRQEPWTFNQETLDINRKYIKLRYKLLPYLYDLFWESQNNGMPIMRPLVLEYERDEKVRNINDQFLLGNKILVAPIVNQGQLVRSIYLPEGEWIDYWTREQFKGNQYILKEAPLDICPIYVKAGSILPNYPEINYVGEKEIDELVLDLYPGTGEYHHFQDNGEDYDYQRGIYNEYYFSLNDKNQLLIKVLHKGYEKMYQSFQIKWMGMEKQILFNTEELMVQMS